MVYGFLTTIVRVGSSSDKMTGPPKSPGDTPNVNEPNRPFRPLSRKTMPYGVYVRRLE